MSGRALPGLDLDRLYAAVEDDAALHALPDVLAAACGGRSAMVLFTEPSAAPVTLMNRWPRDWCERYFAEFTDIDPWTVVCRTLDREDGRPIATDEVLPPETFMRSTVFNELVRPLGDDTARCAGLLLREGGVRFQVGIHRAAGDLPFGADVLARLADARDHLRRVMHLRTLLAGERSGRRRIEAMLDGSDRAMLLVDGRLRIAKATRAGLAILDQRDGIGFANGSLTMASRAALATLRDHVSATIADRAGPHTTLICPRPSGAAAYRVRVLPPDRRTAGHAILVIDDPAADRAGAIRAFAASYGLTAAELALAEGLVAGETLEEVAARRQVTRETIRSQLKALFARTGTARQADLVRLLATLPGSGAGGA